MLDGDDARLDSQPASPPDVAVQPEAIAYHTYKHVQPGTGKMTSMPCTLQLSHGCLSRMANWGAHEYRLSKTDVSLVVYELGSPLFLAQVKMTRLLSCVLVRQTKCCMPACCMCVGLSCRHTSCPFHNYVWQMFAYAERPAHSQWGEGVTTMLMSRHRLLPAKTILHSKQEQQHASGAASGVQKIVLVYLSLPNLLHCLLALPGSLLTLLLLTCCTWRAGSGLARIRLKAGRHHRAEWQWGAALAAAAALEAGAGKSVCCYPPC